MQLFSTFALTALFVISLVSGNDGHNINNWLGQIHTQQIPDFLIDPQIETQFAVPTSELPADFQPKLIKNSRRAKEARKLKRKALRDSRRNLYDENNLLNAPTDWQPLRIELDLEPWESA